MSRRLTPNASALLARMRAGATVRKGYDVANLLGLRGRNTSSAGAAVLASLVRRGLVTRALDRHGHAFYVAVE